MSGGAIFHTAYREMDLAYCARHAARWAKQTPASVRLAGQGVLSRSATTVPLPHFIEIRNPEGVAKPVGCARSGYAGEKDRRFPSHTTERRGQRTDCADVTAGETATVHAHGGAEPNDRPATSFDPSAALNAGLPSFHAAEV